jgi:hypothetical protein
MVKQVHRPDVHAAFRIVRMPEEGLLLGDIRPVKDTAEPGWAEPGSAEPGSAGRARAGLDQQRPSRFGQQVGPWRLTGRTTNCS